MLPGPNGLLMYADRDAGRHGPHRQHQLTEKLPASSQLERVVKHAEDGGRRPADQQRGDLARGDLAGDPDEPALDRGVEHAEGDRHREERDRHRHAAAARDGRHVDPSMVGLVDVVEADREPANERRQHQRQQRGARRR